MLGFTQKTKIAIEVAGGKVVNRYLNANQPEEVEALIAELQRSVYQVSDVLAETNGHVSTLKEQIAKLTSERDEFERDFVTLVTRSKSPQAKPTDEQNAKSAFSLKQQRETQIASAQSSLTTMQAEASHYAQALDELQAKVASWQQHLDEISTNSHGANAELRVAAALRAGSSIDDASLAGIETQVSDQEHVASAKLTAALRQGADPQTELNEALHSDDYEAAVAKVLGNSAQPTGQ